MLEACGISFSYPGRSPLFEGLDLALGSTERVALQAPSGKGKSTLCRIMSGYLAPRSGEVLCDGEPLPKKGVCPVQMIWQHPEKAVDPRMRMKDVLAEAGEVSPELIENLGIRSAWLSRYPHELSGGELQRFCIARAFAANPKYLIADEISTMLDALTQAQIWEFLVNELEKRSVGLLFVSHSPALSDRIATREFVLDSKR